MKVLFVTNMYPHKEYQNYGIFVKEQIVAIASTSKIDYKVYFIEGYKSKFEYLKSIVLINFLIWKWKPDIIHVHHGLSGLFLLFNSYAANRTIVTLHGNDIQEDQGDITTVRLTKRIIKNVALVFTLNNKMFKIVEQINKNVTILKCGIDISVFKCSKKRTNTEKKLLLFPSDPKRSIKNFDLFFNVYKSFRMQFPNIELEFKVVHDFNRAEVNLLLCQADCLLMTSISEGSPQIIKEAMACNLPIVTVDVGDVKDLLSGVENSYIANSFNVNELIGLVEKVLTSEYDRKEGTGREKLIALELGSDLIAKKIIAKYVEIANVNI